jgi:endo-1,4-beta-xylanase
MNLARKLTSSASHFISLGLGLACLNCAPAPTNAALSPAAPVAAQRASLNEDAALAVAPLHKAYMEYFPVGAAVEPYALKDQGKTLAHHFNRLTCENSMKLGPLLPREGAYQFTAADQIAEFARRNGMLMTGHALVWHQMYPAWWFRDGDGAASPAVLTRRLQQHTRTVMERYADVVDNWDVVNEGVSDKPSQLYRDEQEGSKWYGAYQGGSYIEVAFKLAEQAAREVDPTTKLYYNDYNVEKPEKRRKIIQLVRELRAKGARVDGVGTQAHWNLEWPTIAEIRATIDELAQENLLIKVSELDISVYSKDDWDTKIWEREIPYTPELGARLAKRYAEIFALFREKAQHITSVTFWGVSDDRTWLNGWPIGRKNYPLLFDRQRAPKAAFHSVIDFKAAP